MSTMILRDVLGRSLVRDLVDVARELLLNWDPDQPRDAQGRWSAGGDSGGKLPLSQMDSVALLKDHVGLPKEDRDKIASANLGKMYRRTSELVIPATVDRKLDSGARERLREAFPYARLVREDTVDSGRASSSSVGADTGEPPPPGPSGPAVLPLKAGGVVSQKKLGGDEHANAAFKVVLDNGTTAAWKPRSGEETGLRSYVPDGTQYKREAAAYAVAKAVGVEDLVPPTAIRTLGDEVGSVQEWVQAGVEAKRWPGNAYDGDKDARRAAGFDYLIGNTDRHTGNWMLAPGEKIRLIDHGLCLPTKHGDFGNYDLLTHAADKIIPVHFAQLKERWPRIEEALESCGIESEAISLCKQRAWKLAEGAAAGSTFGELPNWYNELLPWRGGSSLHGATGGA